MSAQNCTGFQSQPQNSGLKSDHKCPNSAVKAAAVEPKTISDNVIEATKGEEKKSSISPSVMSGPAVAEAEPRI